jgi:hypothetical protein
VAGRRRGEDKDRVEKTLRWSLELVGHPRKPASKEVLMVWVAQWLNEGVKVDSKKLLSPRGFIVLPSRRVVERSFACSQPKDEPSAASRQVLGNEL